MAPSSTRCLAKIVLLFLIVIEVRGLTFQVPRRDALGTLMLLPTSDVLVLPSMRSNEFVDSLVYEKLLGSGSFKSVYAVSIQGERFALAVSRLTEKAAVKDEVRGIQVAEQLRAMLNENERNYFEQVYDWWFQSKGPSEFSPGSKVFPGNNVERTRKVPKRFLGVKWLVAIKPLYDLDLFAFCRRASTIYPVRSDDLQSSSSSSRVVAGIPLTNQEAIHLVLQMLRAGSIMHSVGLEHRDIKPKNIMLSNGKPVIIDFGFAAFADKGTECIGEQGRIKGEVTYVLAKDAATYRGCKRGDVYAMGKTIYEFLYGDPQEALRQEITPEAVRVENEKFRALLLNGNNDQSRFQLDQKTSNAIVETIRGMCRDNNPLSFSEAGRFLRGALVETPT